MSELVNDGGSAFPTSQSAQIGNLAAVDTQGGMALRDYFAAKAMNALVGTTDGESLHVGLLAAEAYIYADAMLKARAAK